MHASDWFVESGVLQSVPRFHVYDTGTSHATTWYGLGRRRWRSWTRARRKGQEFARHLTEVSVKGITVVCRGSPAERQSRRGREGSWQGGPTRMIWEETCSQKSSILGFPPPLGEQEKPPPEINRISFTKPAIDRSILPNPYPFAIQALQLTGLFNCQGEKLFMHHSE